MSRASDPLSTCPCWTLWKYVGYPVGFFLEYFVWEPWKARLGLGEIIRGKSFEIWSMLNMKMKENAKAYISLEKWTGRPSVGPIGAIANAF